jgi:hypothetical protein
LDCIMMDDGMYMKRRRLMLTAFAGSIGRCICATGYYPDHTRLTHCLAHSTCDGAGFHLQTPGTTTSNAVCACSNGYYPSGNSCLANTCSCTNGNAATGSACTSNGGNICSSCSKGYALAGTYCMDIFIYNPVGPMIGHKGGKLGFMHHK